MDTSFIPLKYILKYAAPKLRCTMLQQGFARRGDLHLCQSASSSCMYCIYIQWLSGCRYIYTVTCNFFRQQVYSQMFWLSTLHINCPAGCQDSDENLFFSFQQTWADIWTHLDIYIINLGGTSYRSELLRWDRRGLGLGDDGGKWIGVRSNPRHNRRKCWIRRRQMGSFKISSAILSQLRHITVHLLSIQKRPSRFILYVHIDFWYWQPTQLDIQKRGNLSGLSLRPLLAEQSVIYFVKRLSLNWCFSGYINVTNPKLANLLQICVHMLSSPNWQVSRPTPSRLIH